MQYCKQCQCGHVMIFEQMGGAPLRCPKCKRLTMFVKEEPYHEPEQAEPVEVPEEEPPKPQAPVTEQPRMEQPRMEQPRMEQPKEEPPKPEEPEQPVKKNFLITLEAVDGGVVIPVREKLKVGRNAAGKDYLGNFPDVTREHFSIAPRANGITATLTDHSRCGTYVNGIRMIKESSVVVSNYSEIRLASRAILLVRVREVEEND